MRIGGRLQVPDQRWELGLLRYHRLQRGELGLELGRPVLDVRKLLEGVLLLGDLVLHRLDLFLRLIDLGFLGPDQQEVTDRANQQRGQETYQECHGGPSHHCPVPPGVDSGVVEGAA